MSTRHRQTGAAAIQVVLILAILVVAAAGVGFMMANRVTPERAEVSERVEPVELLEVRHSAEQVVVSANGTVTPARQVQVRPEVSGRIVALADALIPGGRFAAGETIARIDDRDYRVQVTVQRQALATARLALLQERARQAVAEQEWGLLEEAIPDEEENRDLALRIPQIEQAEAAVAAAEGALAKAGLDLERCTISAPFASTVTRESIDLGQLVTPQTEVATLVGTDAYWVQVSLPVEHLRWIHIPGVDGPEGSPARVIHQAGELEITRTGKVERLLGDVDPAGRLARLLVVITDPLDLDGTHGSSTVPLLIGSYVTVEILGRRLDDVVAIPRRALREVQPADSDATKEGLWIMDDDGRLRTRLPDVVWRTRDTVLVRGGLDDGERLVVSPISTPIEGMRLREVAPGPAADAEADEARAEEPQPGEAR
jgi:RND family efflux transporter MFP subunit